MDSYSKLKTIITSILLVISVNQSQSHSNGEGIESSCSLLVPKHGVSRQNTPSPYSMTFNPSSYTPGSPVSVIINTCTGAGFKGFLIQARRADSSLSQVEALGNFSVIANTRQTCPENAALAHSDDSIKMSRTFTWHPPLKPQGHIVFRATFVRNYQTFWADVISGILADASINTTVTSSTLMAATQLDISCPVNKVSNTSELTKGSTQATTSTADTNNQTAQEKGVVKDTACGVTKGCFSNCHDTVCSYVISWSQEGDYGIYTLSADMASSASTYLALGFSNDDQMGDDSITGCALSKDGSVVLFNGRNTGETHPTLFKDSNVTLQNHSNTDGTLSCTFKRLIAASADGNRVDISKPWILLFARGPASVSSNDDVILLYHGPVNRFVSQSAYRVDDTFDSKARVLKSPLIKAHGSLMVAAWIFFSSIGIVVARYYKEVWKVMMFSQKVWFQIHRTCMALVLCTTIAGFVIIFVQVKGWSTLSEADSYLRAHPIMGVVVTALTVLNPLMALFRPHPGTPRRPIFNWGHWFVGMTAHILGVITIFFGSQLDMTGVPDYLIYILATYVAWQIFVMLVLELISCYGRSKDRKDMYELHTDGDNSCDANLPLIESSLSTLVKRIIIVTHTIFVGALTVSVIVTISAN